MSRAGSGAEKSNVAWRRRRLATAPTGYSAASVGRARLDLEEVRLVRQELVE